MLQTHLLFFTPQPWTQPLLQAAIVPFIGEWCIETKIWMFDVFIVTGAIIPRSSQWTELQNTYTSLFPFLKKILFIYF